MRARAANAVRSGRAVTALSLLLAAAVVWGAVVWRAIDGAGVRADMARVEQLLVAHGFPVEGFAETAPPDLELVDALAPPGCRDVWRTAHLAQLAIVRFAPERTEDSAIIGAAAAIAYADDTGRPICTGRAP